MAKHSAKRCLLVCTRSLSPRAHFLVAWLLRVRFACISQLQTSLTLFVLGMASSSAADPFLEEPVVARISWSFAVQLFKKIEDELSTDNDIGKQIMDTLWEMLDATQKIPETQEGEAVQGEEKFRCLSREVDSWVDNDPAHGLLGKLIVDLIKFHELAAMLKKISENDEVDLGRILALVDDHADSWQGCLREMYRPM